MAVNNPIDINSETRVLKNGAVYDKKRGRIISNPGGGTSAITPEKAREMQAQSVAKKRLVMARAANRDVAPELIAEYGDYAHVAERAITLQMIATTPEAGKAAVMAHDALVRDTGMSEKQAEQAQNVTNNVLVLDDSTRGLLLSLLGDTYATTIDAVTEDVDVDDNDSYRNQSDNDPPPLPHSDAYLPLPSIQHDVAQVQHIQQAGTLTHTTGRQAEEEEKD